jgi:hypothetical protein
MVSLDPLELRLKHMAGTEEEKRHSGKVRLHTHTFIWKAGIGI